MKLRHLFTATTAVIITLSSSATSETIQAPASIKGATIIFDSAPTEEEVFLCFSFEMGSEDTGTTDTGVEFGNKIKDNLSAKYKPQGNKALLCGSFSSRFSEHRYVNYDFGKAKDFSEVGETNFATITFKSVSGNVYKGTYNGYLVRNLGTFSQKLTNITIIIPNK